MRARTFLHSTGPQIVFLLLTSRRHKPLALLSIGAASGTEMFLRDRGGSGLNLSPLLFLVYISDVLGSEGTDGGQVTFGLELHSLPGGLRKKRMTERRIEGETSLSPLGPPGQRRRTAPATSSKVTSRVSAVSPTTGI